MMVNWFGFAAMAHTSPDSAVRGKVDIADIPHGPATGSVSLNVYWILSIAAGSPHRNAAWSFLRHTLTPAMDKLTTTLGAIGCRRSTWQDPDVNAAVPFYHRMAQLRIAGVIDALVTATIATSHPIAKLLRDADAAIVSLDV